MFEWYEFQNTLSKTCSLSQLKSQKQKPDAAISLLWGNIVRSTCLRIKIRWKTCLVKEATLFPHQDVSSILWSSDFGLFRLIFRNVGFSKMWIRHHIQSVLRQAFYKRHFQIPQKNEDINRIMLEFQFRLMLPCWRYQ